MALSGIQIYKMLPQTNCKECGFPTCLAFAMKLAAKQVELSSCPYVSEESKKQLAESAAPPIRLVALKGAGAEVKAGNEVVMFRHEKTFYNKPGLFIHVKASDPDLAAKVAAADAYKVNYVGMDFTVDGFALVLDSDAAAAIQTVRGATKRPLILIGDAAALQAGLSACGGETPLLYAADASNADALAELAKGKAALTVKADSLEALADLTQKIQAKGVEDMVLDLGGKNLSEWLTRSTQVRRLALKANFRALGYPVIAFPCDAKDEGLAAAQAIAKYAGFVVLSEFKPESLYPLLVLRENIYTDPQKPIQVQPGIYEINQPKPESPVLVTTNFSITYFSVANEVEGSGLPAWLVVTDAEGMSVLTAWAAGKFDAERIAKAIKGFDVASKVAKKRVVLPGHVAVLSGELEAELPDWEIRVGPREAVDLPAFMKQALN
ncbi:MAG: corrinoid/iron-sulfur protein large subunit [Anaerolineaceae bacterium]|nr:acetyl-CoA decarbonylase/synthase complex subunit gamma [Anaerolineae bacterium]MBL1171933.1 acetyl-CoA decarbonylase/synthase complex subunit gamma [Chloroflexota bacterium]WKZ55829.1 MAG: acetyl-CoA decarbonylase/synthase complex subunit gamma [Anaerolineales bacterium]GJQ39719.1 MAG: corrinoid/iron-sulfur protein large subunit [Anaerolineaceae bacterium]NOG75400.1 acetyl-CoA decarbonylase/synthase complex subunit gamma [Chloroflexota bacterium]